MGVSVAHAPAAAVDEHLDLVDALVQVALGAGADRDAVGALAEALYDSVALLARRAAPPEPPAPAPPPPPDRYRIQVEGLRAKVVDCVPPGATVAVVSRGDDALVELPGRHGLHLPCREDGAWLGYHPRHAADALDALGRARGLGASHLAVPAPSLWWLAFYGELRQWLQQHAALVHASEDGLVYALPGPALVPTPPEAAQFEAVGRVRRLVATVVSPAAAVVVASGGDDAWLGVAPAARHFPSTPDGAWAGEPVTAAAALAHLHRHRRAGAEYLVVPAGAGLAGRALDEFRREVRRSFPVVVERAAVAVVFSLARHLPAAPQGAS